MRVSRIRWIALVSLALLLTVAAIADHHVNGKWVLDVKLGDGQGGQATLDLKEEAGKLTGTYSGALGSLPLTGTVNAAAFPTANQGTLVPDGTLTNATLETGRVGARCENGFLMIEGDVPNLGAYVLPGNNYHVYDYALFWGSIRADAERRLAAFAR